MAVPPVGTATSTVGDTLRVNLKAVLGGSAVGGAAVSSVLFAAPAGASAQPPTVESATHVPIFTPTAGSSTLPVSNFFVPGCFNASQC